MNNRSSFVPQIQMRPDYLWDATRSCFITDGHDQFTGLIEMQFDQGGKSSPTSKAVNLKCVVFFGLSPGSHEDTIYTLDGPQRGLQPWAGVYQNKTEPTISRLLEQEESRGFSQMLASMGTYLRSLASLPSTLSLQSGDTTSSSFINISLATKTHHARSLNSRRYNLVVILRVVFGIVTVFLMINEEFWGYPPSHRFCSELRELLWYSVVVKLF